MNDLSKDAARIIESYKSAVFAKDVDALLRLYDPGVRVFDAWGVWSYDGADAWRGAVDAWFRSLAADDRVRVSFDGVKVMGASDVLSVTAFVTYAGVSAEGQPVRSMSNRMTWVLRTTGHVLRIVHEHSSAPIGFDDMKAILQRPATR